MQTEAERFGQCIARGEGGVRVAALDALDVLEVDARGVSQRLVSQTRMLASRFHPVSEGLAALVGEGKVLSSLPSRHN